MAANFFKNRRDQIGMTQTGISVAVGRTAAAVSSWEMEIAIPLVPIAQLAAAYQVSQSKMADEVMALRRRIEAREAETATAK